MSNENELMEQAEQAEGNKRPFGERTIVTPRKTKTRQVVEHGGFQDGSTPKTHTEEFEVQKETINVDHSGQFGEPAKGKDWIQPNPQPKGK